ncbi:hypothetical protein [Muriicola sp. Z0-33]|uniref:hypothetical protein n=1 Tax=Muriicola sp. Z0-33 TaxID=2816957 RepID=UPI002237749F|nr:hypothetical protein [Muriicola sp. Z0-33]MCW5515308.1 hypothetical protein [Muriicola sp. Z0-33]
MRARTLYGLIICLFAGAVSTPLCAQETKKGDKKEVAVVKRTLIEKYEPEMILTAEDRARLKLERMALIQKRHSIIDTLDISERRKRSLLKELYRTPHSYKWDKLIADLEFKDEDGY